MIGDRVLAQLERAGAAAGARAADAASAALARRLGQVAGVAAKVADGAVRVSGRGLHARAFGTRRRAADAELVAILAGDT
ncbi:MAG: hypothetical protein RL490_328 [Pseudomonadota bacterium]|jgi:hypothetical protein